MDVYQKLQAILADCEEVKYSVSALLTDDDFSQALFPTDSAGKQFAADTAAIERAVTELVQLSATVADKIDKYKSYW